MWAEIFDRELTAENLFAIQSEISRAIADALQATLSPEEADRIDAVPTNNLPFLLAKTILGNCLLFAYNQAQLSSKYSKWKAVKNYPE